MSLLYDEMRYWQQDRANVAEAELTAANERIGELEAELRHEEQRIADLMGDVNRQGHQITAQREVSDKLERALETVLSDMQSGRFDEDAARDALSEVSALRSANPAIRSKGEKQ